MIGKIKIKELLLGLSRRQKRVVLCLNDALLAALSLWIAYFLRIGLISGSHFQDLIPLFLLVAICTSLLLWSMGFYNNLLRELQIRTLNTLAAGVLLTAVVIAFYNFFETTTLIPRSIPLIFAIVSFLLIGASRIVGRLYYRTAVGLTTSSRPIVIYGAGETGMNAASILDNSREFSLVGFIDDDKSLHGSRIKGRRISGIERLGSLAQRHKNLRVLICIAKLSSDQRRKIIEKIQQFPVQVLTIPSLSDVVAGRADNSDFQEVKLQDLLGREQVPAVEELFQNAIKGKTILVSGGGGSIGSEICVQLAQNNPEKIIVLDHSEFALYQLEQKLLQQFSEKFVAQHIEFLLCDILNERFVSSVLSDKKPDVVYHAAAYKHVPIIERQPLKGVENNILGTYRLANACAKNGVKHFTLVSTDKAVRPTNIMGATKRVAELVIQALQLGKSSTIFSIVRFGNVLGSSGSVIPLFRKQIASGGPVTVTHPKVTRYFMTIPEAAQLVVQASFMAKGGEVFVLDMGEPVLIHKLARLMIQLSGKTFKDTDTPDGEISIEFTGLRPGEKLYEELHITGNSEPTIHPKIMAAEETYLSLKVIEKHVKDFTKHVSEGDSKKAIMLLSKLVEGFETQAGHNK